MRCHICTLIVCFITCFTTTGCAQDAAVSDTESTSLSEAFKQVSGGKALLVDVRSEREWKAGHLAEATHIPVNEVIADKDGSGKISKIKNVSRTIPIYVHCAKGVRASKAAKHLQSLGFDAVALECDYADIQDAGFKASPQE